jgi:hypothetical protein
MLRFDPNSPARVCCAQARRTRRRARAARVCAGEPGALQSAAQRDLRQRATQNCDRQNSEIYFESATPCDRSAMSRFCVRVSRNDEQRQQQSGNFKLVTQRFVSTFSRRATNRQTFTSDPYCPTSDSSRQKRKCLDLTPTALFSVNEFSDAK